VPRLAPVLASARSHPALMNPIVEAAELMFLWMSPASMAALEIVPESGH
jgi:hypothetical protein